MSAAFRALFCVIWTFLFGLVGSSFVGVYYFWFQKSLNLRDSTGQITLEGASRMFTSSIIVFFIAGTVGLLLAAFGFLPGTKARTR